MEKSDYYLKRSSDQVKRAGKYLNDAINFQNQIAGQLNMAAIFFRTAAEALDLKLCDLCPQEATHNKEGKNYCDNHVPGEKKEKDEK